MKLATTIRLTS